MRSYISVEQCDTCFIRCEVENHDISELRENEFVTDCYMADIDRALFSAKGFNPVSGDIYSAIHENGIVIEICCPEPLEKARRIKLLMDLLNE